MFQNVLSGYAILVLFTLEHFKLYCKKYEILTVVVSHYQHIERTNLVT